MSIQTPSALPREQRCFIEAQASLGTFTRPTTTGAIRLNGFEQNHDYKRNDRNDNRATRSLVSRVTDKRLFGFGIDKDLIPSGTAGTTPDDQELWQSLLGTEVVSGGVSVTYTPANTQGLQTNTVSQGVDGIKTWAYVDAVVNKLALSGKGADTVKLKWDCLARNAIPTGPGTAITPSGTGFSLSAAERSAMQVNSIVAQGALTNGGTGFRVTTGGPQTAAKVVEAAHGFSAALVVPFLPAETVAGQPVAGVSGSLSLDGYNLVPISFDLEIDNQLHGLDDEMFTAGYSDFTPGRRKISGKVGFRLRRDFAIILQRATEDGYPAVALTVVLGSVAGSILTISIPRAELENPKETWSGGDDECMVECGFVALASADNAADEISVVFT